MSPASDWHLHLNAALASVLSTVHHHICPGAASWGPLGAGVSRAITWAGAGGSGSTVGAAGGSNLARLPTTPHSPRHRCDAVYSLAETFPQLDCCLCVEASPKVQRRQPYPVFLLRLVSFSAAALTISLCMYSILGFHVCSCHLQGGPCSGGQLAPHGAAHGDGGAAARRPCRGGRGRAEDAVLCARPGGARPPPQPRLMSQHRLQAAPGEGQACSIVPADFCIRHTAVDWRSGAGWMC